MLSCESTAGKQFLDIPGNWGSFGFYFRATMIDGLSADSGFFPA